MNLEEANKIIKKHGNRVGNDCALCNQSQGFISGWNARGKADAEIIVVRKNRIVKGLDKDFKEEILKLQEKAVGKE